jgi:hypothetical protein
VHRARASAARRRAAVHSPGWALETAQTAHQALGPRGPRPDGPAQTAHHATARARMGRDAAAVSDDSDRARKRRAARHLGAGTRCALGAAGAGQAASGHCRTARCATRPGDRPCARATPCLRPSVHFGLLSRRPRHVPPKTTPRPSTDHASSLHRPRLVPPQTTPRPSARPSTDRPRHVPRIRATPCLESGHGHASQPRRALRPRPGHTWHQHRGPGAPRTSARGPARLAPAHGARRASHQRTGPGAPRIADTAPHASHPARHGAATSPQGAAQLHQLHRTHHGGTGPWRPRRAPHGAALRARQVHRVVCQFTSPLCHSALSPFRSVAIPLGRSIVPISSVASRVRRVHSVRRAASRRVAARSRVAGRPARASRAASASAPRIPLATWRRPLRSVPLRAGLARILGTAYWVRGVARWMRVQGCRAAPVSAVSWMHVQRYEARRGI